MPSKQVPLPLSPCRAVPYSLCSTLEKIDCLFLPDCSRVTGCRGGGDEGGPLPPHQDGFFCFCACRKSRNRIREAAQGVITPGEGMSGAGSVRGREGGAVRTQRALEG